MSYSIATCVHSAMILDEYSDLDGRFANNVMEVAGYLDHLVSVTELVILQTDHGIA